MEKDETNEDDNNNDIQSESSSWEIKPKIKEVNPSIERTGEKTGSDSWGTKPKNETKKEGWGSNIQQSTGSGWGSGQRSGGGWSSKNTAKSNIGWGNQTLSDLETNSWWWFKMMSAIIEATFRKMFEQYQFNQKTSW